VSALSSRSMALRCQSKPDMAAAYTRPQLPALVPTMRSCRCPLLHALITPICAKPLSRAAAQRQGNAGG